MTIFIYSLRLFAVDYYGKMLAGSVDYKSYFELSYPSLLEIYMISYFYKNLLPTPSTNFKNKSFFATKSVSQLTYNITAFLRQGVTNEAITPSLVYLPALFSAEVSPFFLSHCMASSWLH